jgi:hypothetical protein
MHVEMALTAIKALLLARFSALAIITIVASILVLLTTYLALITYPNLENSTRNRRELSAQATRVERETNNLNAPKPGQTVSTLFLNTNFLANVSRELHRIQEKHRLTLLRTTFKEDFASSTVAPNIEIQMVVQGTYSQVRQLALGALNSIPALALHSLDFKRSTQAGSAQEAAPSIEAIITLRLFVKAAS